jgi:amino acid adenylation domain-containing protein
MPLNNVEEFYPLSPMQQGILFHCLYDPLSALYFGQLSHTLHGDFDAAAFIQAWQKVLDRHSILRTLFIWEELKEPVQVVQRDVELPHQLLNWRELSVSEQEQRLEAFLQEDRQRGFEFSKSPLMRLTVIQLDHNVHRFIWSHHHLLIDGWSVPLLLGEVFAFYEAFRRGEVLQLEESRPYREYIGWLHKQDLQEAEIFWREYLKGITVPTPFGLANAITRSPVVESRCGDEMITLSTTTTNALQSFARNNQLTLNTLVQGAWSILLSRYSGEPDVIFGATVSGRPADLPASDKMIGLFINTLPVRVKVDSDVSLLTWLKRLQQQQVEVRQYEYSPLVRVQGWSEVPRDLPLFESILIFENYPVPRATGKSRRSLKISHSNFYERINYPLAIIAGVGSTLELKVLYDQQRFPRSVVTSLLEHLKTVLERMPTQAEKPLTSLSVISDVERNQLLSLSTGCEVPLPPLSCAHHLFEAHALRFPDAPAIICGAVVLSYAELNQRANLLAHHLRRLGVAIESLVGICLERSEEMVVAVLAVLKAGGAYLPLDPTYPKDRLAFMLNEAQVGLLVTETHLLAQLPDTQTQTLCLDSNWQALGSSDDSETSPIIDLSPDNLAYLIYTSGSTGRPKGVLLAHRGLINLALAHASAFGLKPQSRLLQFSSFSFDASVSEIFGCLLGGATLCLAPTEALRPGADLLNVLRQQEITTVILPPSVLALLSDTDMPQLRNLISAGEACTSEVVARWSSGRQMINAYGPTETTVCATMTGRLEASEPLSIGRAMDNMRVYVLDEWLEPVPVGLSGEVYIGGVGVARGYLMQPGVTAERFMPEPFGVWHGARMYRTGDIGRYLENGTIEFIGRKDQQVKLRGYRIELGEVEAALARHAGVREAVATLRQPEHGNQGRLVAYVVAEEGQAPSATELRNYLKQSLPEYMLPSSFVHVKKMPLTPNGKVDRKALPMEAGTRAGIGLGRREARTEVERKLVQVWREVLELEQVGVEDNFFDLGGHSLLILQLQGRLKVVLERQVTMVEIFTHPTISALAEHLSKDQKGTEKVRGVAERAQKQRAEFKRQREAAGVKEYEQG